MKPIFDVDRPAGRFFYLLVSLAVAVGVGRAAGPSLTNIQDTVYRANGDPAAGSVVITWPGFTTADNKPVAAGELKVDIATGGSLNVALAPNEGASPAGTYYKVVYKLTDGTTATEYWTVPALSPATIGAIRSALVPQQVAMQAVSRQYVDTAISSTDTQAVHKAGNESINGTKTFAASPAVPTPSTSSDAVNKGYVDAAVTAGGGNFLLRNGDAMTGSLTLAGDPVSSNQAATRHYVDLADQVLSDGLAQKLGRQGDTPVTLASIAFATQYPNIQAAVNAAGPSGALLVPPDYAFTDTYNNPNQIAVLDLRAGGSLKFSSLEATLSNVLIKGAALPSSAGGSHLGSAVQPWIDLYFAGSSSSPGSNNFRLTGSSTSGTRVVTAADGNSVTVLPDAGAANQFLTGITTTGTITRSQPSFANLTGTASAAQGGTGQTTYTKGDLLASPGSTLNRLAVGSDGQVLTADSTQTNGVKWATPASGGGTFLDYQKTASALTGDGTDKTMYTYSMPAGTLPAGRCVRIKTQFQHTTGSANTAYKIFFGATAVATGSSTSVSMSEASVEVCNDPGSTSSQQGSGARYQFGSTMSALAAIATPAEAAGTNPIVLKATFNVANTDQVTPKMWLVEIIK